MEEPLSAIGNVIETNAGMAKVVFKRSKACGDCNACASFGDGSSVVELENKLGAKKGDRVLIELHSGAVFRSSLILYGVPLAALLLGVLVGSRISDPAAALFGLAFVALALVGIRVFEPRFSGKGSFKPEMKRILENDSEQTSERDPEQNGLNGQ